jgi:hypothetical protein
MWYWVILLAANIPVYVGLGRAVFDDWDGFFEALKSQAKPERYGWLVGEEVDDWWEEFKLLALALMCVGIVAGEHWVLTKYVL